MDKYVFKKNNGVDGAAIWNVAGMSIGNPAAIAMAFPLLFGNQVESNGNCGDSLYNNLHSFSINSSKTISKLSEIK